jgi:hypothetical protein
MSYDEIFACESLDLAAVVDAMRTDGACARHLLSERFRGFALEEARAAPFRRGRAVVGAGATAVRQNLTYCGQFPRASYFRVLVRRFQALFDAGARTLDPYPFETRPVFNDMMLQHYAPSALGISPHRDESRYVNLACIFVLEGGGGFYVCEDRKMRGAREIVAPPGSAIFLRCPRLRGTTGRVYHYVADIDTPRTTFGLRHDRGRDERP